MRSAAATAVVLALAGCGELDIGTPNPARADEPYAVMYERLLSFHRAVIRLAFALDAPRYAQAAAHARRCRVQLERMLPWLPPEGRSRAEGWLEEYRQAASAFDAQRVYASQAIWEQWQSDLERELDPGMIASRPEPPPPAADAPAWMLFAAWESLHAQLVQAWSEEKPAEELFARLMQTLQRYHRTLPADRAAKLATYMDSYRAAERATGGFRHPPEGATREDVRDDLRAIGTALRTYCPPGQ